MPEEPSVREVRLGVYATRQQADQLKEQIIKPLCPDPDHAPPCPIPWTVMTLSVSELDDPDAYEELREQERIERMR
ncbi:hypothetical protein EJ357_30055 [Streptomyces cyaneochromogenes]|uniref:Uncharacterized protein n=1 Tax=Streptomyces cyaneochromogenes TaxID=2496836 RepID=A0A3S9MDC7_9ACTN|nr:hypothetical protein [Streptomyces cyaneochromogenes]AZQ37169.1 hypothetical protein EJ357_30055 [Streptomyces cyaneochromogenes]